MGIFEPSDWPPLNLSGGGGDDKEKTEENRKTTDSVRAKKIHKLLRDVNLMHSHTVHFVHTSPPYPAVASA